MGGATTLCDLSLEKLQHIVAYSLDAGLLNPFTLTPLIEVDSVVDKEEWSRVRIKRHMFDLPRSMSQPQFVGEGGYGCVAKCVYNKMRVAVKKVAIPSGINRDDMLRLLREVLVLRKVQAEDQCLTPLLHLYSNADCTAPNKLKHIYMVMPLYDPGCLELVRVDNAALFRSIASQTLSGLYWLHAHEILHRDLKRENIFYDRARNRAVLGDLGSARTFGYKMTGKDGIGTKSYLAPEILSEKSYSYASDVWSLAVCWYEMLCLEDGQATMFPLLDADDAERLTKQKAFCALIHRGRKNDWAEKTWRRVGEMEKEWKEWRAPYSRIFRRAFVLDPKLRPLTENLYEDSFFRYKPDIKSTSIEGIDAENYEDARVRLYMERTIKPGNNTWRDDENASTCASNKRLPEKCPMGIPKKKPKI